MVPYLGNAEKIEQVLAKIGGVVNEIIALGAEEAPPPQFNKEAGERTEAFVRYVKLSASEQAVAHMLEAVAAAVRDGLPAVVTNPPPPPRTTSWQLFDAAVSAEAAAGRVGAVKSPDDINRFSNQIRAIQLVAEAQQKGWVGSSAHNAGETIKQVLGDAGQGDGRTLN